jgi:hypothetical protein
MRTSEDMAGVARHERSCRNDMTTVVAFANHHGFCPTRQLDRVTAMTGVLQTTLHQHEAIEATSLTTFPSLKLVAEFLSFALISSPNTQCPCNRGVALRTARPTSA